MAIAFYISDLRKAIVFQFFDDFFKGFSRTLKALTFDRLLD